MTYTILYHELIRQRARLSHLLALHIANCHSLRIVLKHYFAVIGLCQVAHAIWTQNKEILFRLVAMFACLIPTRFYELSLRHKFDSWRLINRVNAHLRAPFGPNWCKVHLHFNIVLLRFTWSCGYPSHFLASAIRCLLLLELLLLLQRECPCNVLVFIDDKLECSIVVILKIFEPIVKIVAEPFVRLN
jgi:uncharacterized membrane protein